MYSLIWEEKCQEEKLLLLLKALKISSGVLVFRYRLVIVAGGHVDGAGGPGESYGTRNRRSMKFIGHFRLIKTLKVNGIQRHMLGENGILRQEEGYFPFVPGQVVFELGGP